MKSRLVVLAAFAASVMSSLSAPASASPPISARVMPLEVQKPKTEAGTMARDALQANLARGAGQLPQMRSGFSLLPLVRQRGSVKGEHITRVGFRWLGVEKVVRPAVDADGRVGKSVTVVKRFLGRGSETQALNGPVDKATSGYHYRQGLRPNQRSWRYQAEAWVGLGHGRVRSEQIDFRGRNTSKGASVEGKADVTVIKTVGHDTQADTGGVAQKWSHEAPTGTETVYQNRE